jgi:hypothetical protein
MGNDSLTRLSLTKADSAEVPFCFALLIDYLYRIANDLVAIAMVASQVQIESLVMVGTFDCLHYEAVIVNDYGITGQ